MDLPVGMDVSKKGSPRPPATRGATLGNLDRLCRRMHSPAGAGAWGKRPGRLGRLNRLIGRWGHRFPCPSAKPQSHHIIGGAATRAPSPRRWEQYFARLRRCQSARLFSQIIGQDKAFRAGKTKAYQSYVRFDRHAKADGLDAISGKSMIEMLAVLAIMGVLAIGGIAAYSFAVSKHRANQIYNQVDLRAVTAFSNPIMRQTLAGNTFFLPGFEDTFENLTYEQTKRERAAFEIKVSNVPEKVCKRLQDMTFKLPRQVTLNGEDISSTCGTQNTFVFVYDGLSVGKPSSGVDPIDCTCSGCQSCENGTCQDNDNLCGPKEVCQSGSCVCAPDYTECRGGCYTTCADGLIRDPITCDCVCEAQECPEHASWDSTTCSCICEDGYDMCNDTCHPACTNSGMTGARDPDTCNCLCIDGIDGTTCKCPDGYILVDGMCQKMDCRGVPGSFDCYINDNRCGYQCSDAEGLSCQQGFCYPEQCLPYTGENGSFVTTANWTRYGCQSADKSIQCYPTLESWRCTHPTYGDCCTGSQFGQCEVGSCEPSVCDAVHGQYAQDTFFRNGCEITDTGTYVFCNPALSDASIWHCYWIKRTSTYNTCGRCTAEELKNRQCSKTQSDGSVTDCFNITCPTGMSWDSTLNRCVTTDGLFSCDIEEKCYIGTTDTVCGTACPLFNHQKCAYGLCQYGVCDESKGFYYENVTGVSNFNARGCVKHFDNGDVMACYSNDTGEYGMQCRLNGQICGAHGCNYDGTDCPVYYMSQCAPNGLCIYGTPIDACICNGNETNGYCCPEKHQYINGSCTLTTCPEGEEPDDNGICQPI